jgi:hypothetical protein
MIIQYIVSWGGRTPLEGNREYFPSLSKALARALAWREAGFSAFTHQIAIDPISGNADFIPCSL